MVILSSDSFLPSAHNLRGPLASSLRYASIGDIASVTHQQSLCRSVPSLALTLGEKASSGWSLGTASSIPTSNTSWALVLGQLHDLTMVLSPAVKWKETYFFPLLSLATAVSLYLIFIYLQFKTESRIIPKAPAGCLGSLTSLG